MALPNRLGNNDAKDRPEQEVGPSTLLSYVLPRIRHARDVRDRRFEQKWCEYTRLWRGQWSEDDRNYDSERSRLISPALAQAIEMTASEIEEAVFGRQAWFDITDDIQDEVKDDALRYRDQLLEDFEIGRVPQSCSQVFLLGCIYGTGIGKINVTIKEIAKAVEGRTVMEERVLVTLDPIRPDEFLIDPAARTVDEAHFVAHEMLKPRHLILQKQKAGIYRNVPLGVWTNERPTNTTGTSDSTTTDAEDDGVLITEYFGRVPASLLPGAEGTGLVEAVITVANESVILRAQESPFLNKDRPVIAYQHEVVPGEFWGRGVAEKGYNPQKALDAELRARMDALALITSPMLGADVTRLPRNPDMRVRPGKVFFTRGRASEILEPIGFSPQALALSFQQSSDLERQVQVGTGAMDSATPLHMNRRNETVGGMSQIQSGFLKRAKRTMHNIEREFLDPLIRRSLWRYMQFDPERYPFDMQFVVHSTMGLMAKEVEQTTLTQLLGFLPPNSPAVGVITAAILNNTTSAQQGEIKKAVEAMLAPPSKEEQALQAQLKQLEIAKFKLEVAKLEAEVQAEQAKAAKLAADAKLAEVKADLEDDRVDIDAANAAINAENARNRRRELAVKERQASARNTNGDNES